MPRVVFPMGSPTSRNTAVWIPSWVTNKPEYGGFDSQWGHWKGRGVRGGAVGWGNVLQVRISRFRFPVASLVTNWIKINMCCVSLNKYGLFATNPILRQLNTAQVLLPYSWLPLLLSSSQPTPGILKWPISLQFLVSLCWKVMTVYGNLWASRYI